MIKRILVPLDPSPYAQTALHLATMIAARNDAEVTSLVILDIPGIEDSIGPIPVGGIHFAEKLEEKRKAEAKERIEDLLEKAKTTCEKAGVRHVEAERQGSPSNQILKASRFYDILIMGLKTHFNFETTNKSGNSLHEMLAHSVTPVYAVPESLGFTDEEKIRVLIAYDGSYPATRALHAFAQRVVPELMEVTLLHASKHREDAYYLLDQAEAYLQSQDIKNVKKEWTTESVIQTIRDEYYDRTDVFVIGAHTKDSFLDFMVGSLTKYLVNRAEKPVFIGL